VIKQWLSYNDPVYLCIIQWPWVSFESPTLTHWPWDTLIWLVTHATHDFLRWSVKPDGQTPERWFYL